MKKIGKSARDNADDAPITEEEAATARPIKYAPPEVLKALEKSLGRSLGRPKGRTKQVVSLSLDKDLVKALRATGAGWQTRANQALREVFKPSGRSA
jgi:uncharacterized protein (DUF4415 family)